MPDENSRRHIEHAVVRIQLLNRGTTAGGIPLAKKLLKVAVQEFVNSFTHAPSPCLITNRPSPFCSAMPACVIGGGSGTCASGRCESVASTFKRSRSPK